MNSSYICGSCRRTLSRNRPQKVLQWHARASFISLSDRASRSTTEVPSSHETEAKSHEDDSERPTTVTNGRRKDKKTGGAMFAGDSLETLFREALQTTTPTNTSQKPPSDVLNLYKNVDTLRKMLRQGGNEADAWLFFVEHFGPNAEKHPFDKSIVSRVLLKDIIMAKRKNPLSHHLPSVTEVSTISYQLDLLNGFDWSNLVTDLIEHILILRQKTGYSSEEVERLTADLIGAWNVVCRPLKNSLDLPSYQTTSLNWLHLPRFSTGQAMKVYRQRGLLKCFNLLTPSFHRNQVRSIPLIVVATFQLLVERTEEEEMSHEYKPLVTLFAKILKDPALMLEDIVHSADRSTTKTLNDYVVSNIGKVKEIAGDMIAELVPEHQDTNGQQLAASIEARHPFEKRTQISIQNMRSKLDRSVKEQDASQTDRLWEIARHWPIRPLSDATDKKRGGGGVLTSFLLNKFIFSYMALAHPNRAIDVWNTMVENGIRPDSAAWTAMLSGARAARDMKALDQIWTQMRATKIELTKDAWTARVCGLIECRMIGQGLHALDEMGRMWLTEAKVRYPKLSQEELVRLEESVVKGITKPSTEMINVTVSTLMRQGKKDAAGRVLAWASRFGIAPSAFTYNILLRPLIRSGDRKAAMNLIKEMEAAGVPPDAGTFVAVIEDALRGAENYTVEEQQNIIASIFEEMVSLGLVVSKGLYGHIIHGLIEGLIKCGSRDTSVVDAVMAQMTKDGWLPDSIEYTELLRFHLDHDPPDMAAVDGLVHRAVTSPKALSHIFWDRVLEGYSRAGETVKAMAVYKDIRQRNRIIDTSKVAWRAIHELVLALSRNGEWETAKEVVKQKVGDCGGPLPKDHDVMVSGQHSQYTFWETARELELLEDGNVK